MSTITNQEPSFIASGDILASGAVFESVIIPVSGMKTLRVMVFSDQGSAVDGLKIKQSLNPDEIDQFVSEFTVGAGAPATTEEIDIFGDFLQVEYTNGGTDQVTFNLKAKAFAV